MRTRKKINSRPMTAETASLLYATLERRYPGKVWRVIEVCPVAVVKTIDNEDDAIATLHNLMMAET